MVYSCKTGPATDEFRWYIGTNGGASANMLVKASVYSVMPPHLLMTKLGDLNHHFRLESAGSFNLPPTEEELGHLKTSTQLLSNLLNNNYP